MEQRTWLIVKWPVWVILAVFSFSMFILGMMQSTTPTRGESVVILVKSGMTSDQIAQMLYKQGVIESAGMFQLVAKWKSLGNSLQAGEYSVVKGTPVTQIVDMLARGQTNYQQLTIPEGYTVNQIAKLIGDKQLGNPEKFRELARRQAGYDYMTGTAPAVMYATEGYLFPDTYQIAKGATEEQLLNMLLQQFNEKLTPQMREKAKAMGLSVRELIILASLVEKEAQLEADRPIIAGVFLNRLKQDMPLQSCATIQYILGYPKPELTVEDTQIPSPFNTYQHKGLPPGPIANPGLASINAVLQAAPTDYLYFVADKNGAHHFSRTYEEHLQEIEKVRN